MRPIQDHAPRIGLLVVYSVKDVCREAYSQECTDIEYALYIREAMTMS